MAIARSAIGSGPDELSKPLLQSNAQTDLKLMERLRDGDEAALGDLLDRYWKRLVRYAAGFVGDLESAEDLVQDAFVRVWRNRLNWETRGSASSYLYRIVRNLALQENEKRVVRRRFRVFEMAPDSPLTPEEEFESTRRKLRLQAAVASLPPRRREILILFRFHDLPYSRIAEIMGISVHTVANQMTSALGDLRKALERPEP